MTVNALPIIIGALAIYAIAYRYYSAFIAAKVLALDDKRVTPAHRMNDGQNYVPTNKWVLFGHHFAAITGAGPLIGPVLAAQFGFLPGLLWLVVGVCIGGAVHDFIILSSSIRRGGKSLAEMARTEISSVTGIVAAIAILFIIVMALAGLGLAVVNALHDSSWGTFTIAMTIPIALFMGLYMYRFRKGRIAEASAIGVVLLILAVVAGRFIPESALASFFTLPKNQITIAIALYGFIASILPVWMLLCPRDYLSSYMKIGTIAFLVIGIIVVHPELKMPAFTEFTAGGGPIVPGKLYPFVFITIACGAISGFHALIGSGTTPKMIDKETHARPIGYGAMLIESLVGVTALIASTALFPADYFAINVPVEKFAQLGLSVVNLPELEKEVGESVAGRTGGAVSLAVGMAQIFTALPGMKGLMAYWYHFAIMFEALFILTTIDTGTRVARFLVQEFLGKFYKPLERADWMPGTVISSALVCVAWAYFISTGSISQIWPMFGVANQLLAAIALAVGTTIIINAGKVRYAWVTIVPLSFVGTTTLVAGWKNITDNFLPMTQIPGKVFQGYLDAALTAIIMVCAVIVFANSIFRWYQVLSGKRDISAQLAPAVE
ncbi:MAG: carbon starvation CstA family protein [bacterium]